MSEDSNDPKNLEICKQHIVFQHFPMYRLETNPGTWSVLKYKYGRLIVKDSNNLDWIYVIKSGEARVFKYLQPGQIDIQARRKKVQAMINAQSSFYKKKKILSFVEERDYIKSSYSPRKYHPSTRSIMSAPAGHSRDQFLMPATTRRDVATCIPGKRQNRNSVSSLGRSSDQSRRSNSRDRDHQDGVRRQKSSSINEGTEKSYESGEGIKLPALILPDDSHTDEYPEHNDNDKNEDENKETQDLGKPDTDTSTLVVRETIQDLKQPTSGDNADVGQRKNPPQTNGRRNDPSSQTKSSLLPARGGRARSGSFLKTPVPGTTTRSSASHRIGQQQQSPSIQVGSHTLPAFVQVETLHPGQVFGLRSCLDPEERGPNVSLVSGECEILQINKKFFMKHCDDAVYSLIRLKAKPFPSQEDLIDRLDVNMQWEEYKQKTMVEFLQQSRRLER